MNCYNCNKPLSKKENHEEHIPAKNLFKTYPAEYKKNLLKVPSCFKCNNDASVIDQEIRDAIGIQYDGDILQKEMSEKALKSIFRNQNWKERIFVDEYGRKFEFSFKYNDLIKLHIKNFKGLFYNKYGHTLPERFEIRVIAEGDENNSNLQFGASFINIFLNDYPKWEIVGHEDIFKYKLKSLVNDNGMFYDNNDISNSIGFFCNMVYHNKLKPFVVALDLNRIDEMQNKLK